MLDSDSNLDRVQEVEGYKVLPPCVLYGKIGQGGMGAVYRGRHLNLDIDVAVKCLKPSLTGDDEQFVLRFRREARSAARINHQNVVRVFDVSEEQGLHYIVMELVQGETARQRVQRKGKLSVGEALEILYGAALGLGEAHSRGFIHRDVKPDNIMIASTGAVKVADLGLAKPSGQSQMSMVSGTNVVMGTPQYMPPEQWENAVTVTSAADVWALGATLYYLLVGGEAIGKDSLPRIMQRIVLQPFPDVRDSRPDVPDDVAQLIKRATARSPDDRFANASELSEAIARLDTRRETLRDSAGVSDGEHNTLLSPPPAKTLAKIKFWLDDQGASDQPPAGEAQTMVSPASRAATAKGEAEVATEPERKRTGLVAAITVLLGLVVSLAIWQPWLGGSKAALDTVARLVRVGEYAQAVGMALELHDADATLAGKKQRLAQLHLAWARHLQSQGDVVGSLAQLARSVGYQSSSEADNLRRSVLAKAAMAIDQDLQRSSPATTPVRRDGTVMFRGRLASALVDKLLIAGQVVALRADGSFATERELSGNTTVEVAVRLVSGDSVTLAPWAVVYGGAQKPNAQKTPVIKTAPASVPGKPRPIEPKPVAQPKPRDPEPAKVTALALSFVRAASFVDLQHVRGDLWATDQGRVQIRGELSDVATRLLVNGKVVNDCTWSGSVFTMVVPVEPGLNTLTVVAERRSHAPCQQQLLIERVADPRLVMVEGSGDRSTVASDDYAVVVDADVWTESVELTLGKQTDALLRDGQTQRYRGQVTLAEGSNQVVVRAVNVFGRESMLQLDVTYEAGLVRPELRALQVRVGDELQDVRRGRQVFLAGPAVLLVDTTDNTAVVRLNGDVVSRNADGSVPLAGLREATATSSGVSVELVLENSLGQSEPFRFIAWLDVSKPSVQWQPLQPVAKGQPFELRGTWVDAGGLRRDGSKLGELSVRLSPRGVAKKGTWRVKHPGLAATTTLVLDVVDRAGNRTTLAIKVEVR